MRARKVTEVDYIQFLVATQKVFSCTEAQKCQPFQPDPPAHDAFTRLLERQPPDTAALWQEVKEFVQPHRGALILDDSTLDKPYSKQTALVTWHWSGKHHRVVPGINLLTLLWNGQEEQLVPCDFRLYDKPFGGLDKNEHFRHMVRRAKERGFAPEMVLFDGWYSSLENLKLLRSLGWPWLTRLKGNRLVNPDGDGNLPIRQVEIPKEGREVHLKGYGFIKVFRTVAPDGDVEHWATSELEMTEEERREWARRGFGIESYHRGLKQCCGVEKCQGQRETVQRGHIQLAIRAFVRLERHWMRTGVSWYEAKENIIREAIRSYLSRPLYEL